MSDASKSHKPTPKRQREFRQRGEVAHSRDVTAAATLLAGTVALAVSAGAVWRALCAIPFGATCGYGELAARLGRPSAARAVGAANGKNPIAIVVPCHRVIGKDGTLTGYAGGVAIKQWLLEHEARITRA